MRNYYDYGRKQWVLRFEPELACGFSVQDMPLSPRGIDRPLPHDVHSSFYVERGYTNTRGNSFFPLPPSEEGIEYPLLLRFALNHLHQDLGCICTAFASSNRFEKRSAARKFAIQ